MNFDPASIPRAWPLSGDFTLPDWDAINDWVDKSRIQEPELNAVYESLCRYWMETLRNQLGGDYHIVESKNFHLLTAQAASTARASLQILESTVADILREWDGVASDIGYGPHMAIIFDEIDDYYDYIAQYFPDVASEFAGSSGVMLDQGFAHIAIAQSDLTVCSGTLFHEITHILVNHLPLPLWINEGLATSAERVLSHNKTPLLDEQLAGEHRAYWNEHNIQEFWNGDSFSIPGKSQELSYNLAEILACQLRIIPGYRNFILDATWEDAGEEAAQTHFSCGVGDIAAIFLGDGPWGLNWADTPEAGEEARS